MFSAVYLVCLLTSGDCQFYVDPLPYPTLKDCEETAALTIEQNKNDPANVEHTAKFMCLNWLMV